MKNILLPLRRKLYVTFIILWQNKNFRNFVLLLLKLYNEKITIYLASSRIPYYLIIMRTYLNPLVNKAKIIKSTIKSYFNNKK
jgi:hypothetical protein